MKGVTFYNRYKDYIKQRIPNFNEMFIYSRQTNPPHHFRNTRLSHVDTQADGEGESQGDSQ